MNLIFLGPPGSGKGTMSERTKAKFGLAHISTGDMLRSEIKEGTELGDKAASFMEKGQLVPDEVIISMVDKRLKNPDCQKGFILDGFPRTLEQARALSDVVKIDACVEFSCSEEKLFERIGGRRVCSDCGYVTHVGLIGKSEVCPKCSGKLIQRKDDTVDTIKSRLEVYYEQTAPLIEYYASLNNLIQIQVEGSADEVFADLSAKLDKMC